MTQLVKYLCDTSEKARLKVLGNIIIVVYQLNVISPAHREFTV